MPNINLLPAINTATSSTFVVVSDRGFARRVDFENFVHSVEQGFAGPARTNQNLYTTSSVRFYKVGLAGTTTSTNSTLGISTIATHSDGSSIKNKDIIGSLRFGGYDGSNSPEGTFSLSASANNNWSYLNTATIDAGTSWSISYQPERIRLSSDSVMKVISGSSTSTSDSSVPPTMLLKFGSGIDKTTPTLTSRTGTHTYTGFGRTEIGFYHSRLTQYGVVSTGTVDNTTLYGTNIYTFYSSRQNAGDNSRRLHVQQNDGIGIISFNGEHEDASSGNGQIGAQIRASTTEEWSTSTNGTQLSFWTAPTSYVVTTTSTSTVVASTAVSKRVSVNDQRIIHNSHRHTFEDSRTADSYVDMTTGSISIYNDWFSFIRNGGLRFPDGSEQNTAYTGGQGSSYSPTTPGDWANTPPTTLQEAIDRLAAAFKIANGTGA